MSMRARPAVKLATLILACSLAPVALAQQAPPRDTGVGKEIAAQGNRALQIIRAEALAAVRSFMPAMPAAPRVVKASQPAGSTVAAGATVRCEQ